MEFLLYNNTYLFVILAILSGSLLIMNYRKQGKTILPSKAVALANHEHALFIDIRSEQAFAQGAIAQARHIPADQLASRVGTLPKNKPFILISDNAKETAKAVNTFKQAEISNVHVLEGGMSLWLKENLPIKVTATPTVAKKSKK